MKGRKTIWLRSFLSRLFGARSFVIAFEGKKFRREKVYLCLFTLAYRSSELVFK
jgi:hypothetical protein